MRLLLLADGAPDRPEEELEELVLARAADRAPWVRRAACVREVGGGRRERFRCGCATRPAAAASSAPATSARRLKPL